MKLTLSCERIRKLVSHYLSEYVELSSISAADSEIILKMKLNYPLVRSIRTTCRLRLDCKNGALLVHFVEYPLIPKLLLPVIRKFKLVKKELPTGVIYNSKEHQLRVEPDSLLLQSCGGSLKQPLDLAVSRAAVRSDSLELELNV